MCTDAEFWAKSSHGPHFFVATLAYWQIDSLYNRCSKLIFAKPANFKVRVCACCHNKPSYKFIHTVVPQ